jgi:hypothetical protein
MQVNPKATIPERTKTPKILIIESSEKKWKLRPTYKPHGTTNILFFQSPPLKDGQMLILDSFSNKPSLFEFVTF